MATRAELAMVLPSTMVASSACGSDNIRARVDPVSPPRSLSCRVCHLLRENNADSARAKKKLMPANKSTPAAARYGMKAMGNHYAFKPRKQEGELALDWFKKSYV